MDVSRSTRRLVASLPSYLFRISGSLARSLSTYLVDKRQDFALPICTADVLTPSRSLDSHPCPSHPSLGPSGEYLTVVVASRRRCSPVRTTFLSTRPWRVQKRHQVRAGVNKWRDIFYLLGLRIEIAVPRASRRRHLRSNLEVRSLPFSEGMGAGDGSTVVMMAQARHEDSNAMRSCLTM